MTAFIMPLAFIFLAELGDKSMLLALAFASKYPVKTVIAGVFCATAINHLLVVLLGSYIVNFFNADNITLFCSLAFIGFGIWTLRGDSLEEDDMGTQKKTPFLTVATAFFISEMGDKTQLATLTLATEYQPWLLVWIGSTIGMVLADMVGIIAGNMLGKRIPENTIKYVSGSIFILTGMWGLYEYPLEFEGKLIAIIFFGLLSFTSGHLLSRRTVSA